MFSGFLAGDGWANTATAINNFFQNGLVGKGFPAAGAAVMVIGLASAVLSFILHHFNPQSRFPSWIKCLLIGVAGALIVDGPGKAIDLFKEFKDWVYSLLGI